MHADAAELMRQAIAGDETATMTLLACMHAELCRRTACRIPADVRGQVDAEDIVQDSAMRVFQNIRHFVPDGEDSFDRWVTAITFRRLRNVIQYHRAQKRGAGRTPIGGALEFEDSAVALLDLMATASHSPSRSAAGHEAVVAVQAALDRLPADYAQAVRLVYLEGVSVADVAGRMNRTERAIYNLCHKAKDRLRELLGSRSDFLTDG